MDRGQIATACLLTFWASLMAFFIGLITGINSGRKAEQLEAMKAGVGNYVVDPSSGSLTFRYRSPTTENHP